MLHELFGSRLRAKVLGWLFLHPDERFFVRQLTSLLREDVANTSRELARLAGTGILTCRTEGRQKYYQANRVCSVFSELQGLVRKTSGLADVLQNALKPLAAHITVAFVYGSMATDSPTSASDVDVMVVGDCSFGEVVDAVTPAQDMLGREVNPSVYSAEEFADRAAGGQPFLKSVLEGAKVFLIGDAGDLARLAEKRLAHRT